MTSIHSKFTINKIKRKTFDKNESRRRIEEVMHNFINKRSPSIKKSYKLKRTNIGDEDHLNAKEHGKVSANLSINLNCKLI